MHLFGKKYLVGSRVIEKSRARSSRCCGLSLVSSHISCMGWVGELNQIWTDSGSQRRLHKLTSDLTQ